MNNQKKQLPVMLLICSALLLTGCGPSDDLPKNPSAAAENNVEIVKTIEKSDDGTIEVMQITSTNIKYDGDHGIRFARISRHPDYLTVVLDLDENNIITRVEDQHTEGHPKSRQYQAFFKNAIAAEVVGKSLSEVSDLAVVAGASTTTEAWNAAIEDIQSQITNAQDA